MKNINTFENFLNENLNESNRSKRGNNKINFLKDSTSDVDQTRLVKWLGQHIDSNKYFFEKSKIVGYWILDVKKLSERELKDLLQYLESEKYKFGTQIWLPAYTGDGFESVVYEAKGKPTKDSSIIDHYGKTIKQVLEDEDGENEYLTIQFTDNTEMYITAYPTGNGGVGLVVESLNEKIINEAINEASTNEFINMKMEIYAEAKKEYLEAIKNELTKVGFTINKINAKYDQFEYSNDTIDCTYKGEDVNLTMSISGNSLGVSNLDISGYTTKAAVLAKKLDKLLK